MPIQTPNSAEHFHLLNCHMTAGDIEHRSSTTHMTNMAGDDDGDDGAGRGSDRGGDVGVATKVKPKVKKPNLYRVLLLNDDYTPMEFVILVLQRFFNKNADDANKIMWHVHKHGMGECGVFTYEVAETKVSQVMDFAQGNQHPLQCVMEKQ